MIFLQGNLELMAKIRELENEQISSAQNFSQQEKQFENISNKTIFGASTRPKGGSKHLKEQLVMIISIVHQRGATTSTYTWRESGEKQTINCR